MKWLDKLLDEAPFPCLCNKKTPDYGKGSAVSYFVMCPKCGRCETKENKRMAIYAWDSRMMREVGQR